MAQPEILSVASAEAVAHFRAKGYHVGYSWLDTSEGEHVRPFTVAKAAKLDILEALRSEVDHTIAEGTKRLFGFTGTADEEPGSAAVFETRGGSVSRPRPTPSA